MIDLHVHTTASDGSDSPETVVNNALAMGLKAIAITDHDTVGGIQEAMDAATGKNITVIPGIEFSTNYKINGEEKELHILGYNIDYKNEAFVKRTLEIASWRYKRNEDMCAKLREHTDSKITVEKLEKEYPKSVLTRANFANYLVKEGIVNNKDDAFRLYINKECPCYVAKERISVEEAIQLIKGVGGKAVLAHPVLIKGVNDIQLKELISGLAAMGIDGLECHYSNNKPGDTEKFKQIAKENNLFITGGSDYHGELKRIKLGMGYNNSEAASDFDYFEVPDELLDNIL